MFVIFDECLLQHIVGISMDINRFALLTELLIYLSDANFVQGFLKKNEK
jgi:hypothetical protein